MTKITVLGGTGYTGSNVVREAAKRGHDVTSFSRNAPQQPIAGVRYVEGSMLQNEDRVAALAGADVVVGALAARGDLQDELRSVYARLAALAADSAVRIGIVGGFSSLRPAAGAPRMGYGDGVPPQFAAEARIMAEIVDDFVESAPESLDWFFISPGAAYGVHAPGEEIGSFRIGDDVALFDASGASAISGVDFAAAIVDEIETSAHSRAQFSVAY